MKTITILAALLCLGLCACDSQPDSSSSGDSSQSSTPADPAPAPVADAQPASSDTITATPPEQAAAPAPEPEEKPKPWTGRCYSGGQVVWSGDAINFSQDNSCTGGNTGCEEFNDADTGKRIQIEGAFSCVWNKPEGS